MTPILQSPTSTNNIYQLYIESTIPEDASSPKSHWILIGTTRFAAGKQSFGFADQQVSTPEWDIVSRNLSWSNTSKGNLRVPTGSLNFAENLLSFSGQIIGANGKHLDVRGALFVAYFKARRQRRSGVNPPTAPLIVNTEDFVYGAQLDDVIEVTVPVVRIINRASGEILYDLSNNTNVMNPGGIGGPFRLVCEQRFNPYIGFDISFSDDLQSFSGIYIQSNVTWDWTGAFYTPPVRPSHSLSTDSSEESSVAYSAQTKALEELLPLQKDAIHPLGNST